MKNAYITRISKFLPNSPVENDQIEEKLGFIDGQKSRAKSIILRNNKIKTRYYAIDEDGNVTHNNAQLTAAAIEELCSTDFNKENIELLSCGTSTPDQLLPSHAAMVHGVLKNGNMEINSASGVCCSGMNALKYGYMAIQVGSVNNAVCTGSEKVSTWTKADFYQEENRPNN